MSWVRLLKSRSFSRVVRTAPESIASAAREVPSLKSAAMPATTRAAAALSRTTSRRGPGSPLKMAVRMTAFAGASPPSGSRRSLRGSPASSGVI